tara:strand:+ start:2037 stop:2396 length:360 start_codon:yes stop_codon:yes gene_type:complete
MAYVNSDSIVGHPLSGSNKTVQAQREYTLDPHVKTPTGNVVEVRPASVIIKEGVDVGDISFNFTTTGSVGNTIGTDDGSWVNFGHKFTGSNAELDIQPTAWKGSVLQTAGAVIFVYKKV